jgi:hypothetical protein
VAWQAAGPGRLVLATPFFRMAEYGPKYDILFFLQTFSYLSDSYFARSCICSSVLSDQGLWAQHIMQTAPRRAVSTNGIINEPALKVDLRSTLRHRPSAPPRHRRPARLDPASSAASSPTWDSGSGAPDADASARVLLQPDGIIDPDGTVIVQPPMDEEERQALWKAAIKAPMYTVGAMPILVSAALAYVETGTLFPLRTLGFLAAAMAIIAWLNLSNDVFDSITGVDKNKRESVVALTGSRGAVFVAAHAALAIGGGLLFWLLQPMVSFFFYFSFYFVLVLLVSFSSLLLSENSRHLAVG